MHPILERIDRFFKPGKYLSHEEMVVLQNTSSAVILPKQLQPDIYLDEQTREWVFLGYYGEVRVWRFGMALKFVLFTGFIRYVHMLFEKGYITEAMRDYNVELAYKRVGLPYTYKLHKQ